MSETDDQTRRRFGLDPDKWLTFDEAIQMIMDRHTVSRDEAVVLLAAFARRKPEYTITVKWGT